MVWIRLTKIVDVMKMGRIETRKIGIQYKYFFSFTSRPLSFIDEIIWKRSKLKKKKIILFKLSTASIRNLNFFRASTYHLCWSLLIIVLLSLIILIFFLLLFFLLVMKTVAFIVKIFIANPHVIWEIALYWAKLFYS